MIHNKIEEIVEKLKANFTDKNPAIVLAAGDFNSLAGYPGIVTFKARGYTDFRGVRYTQINH